VSLAIAFSISPNQTNIGLHIFGSIQLQKVRRHYIFRPTHPQPSWNQPITAFSTHTGERGGCFCCARSFCAAKNFCNFSALLASSIVITVLLDLVSITVLGGVPCVLVSIALLLLLWSSVVAAAAGFDGLPSSLESCAVTAADAAAADIPHRPSSCRNTPVGDTVCR
jgi:hypothetical protein